LRRCCWTVPMGSAMNRECAMTAFMRSSSSISAARRALCDLGAARWPCAAVGAAAPVLLPATGAAAAAARCSTVFVDMPGSDTKAPQLRDERDGQALLCVTTTASLLARQGCRR
jgi:hypothetical protein